MSAISDRMVNGLFNDSFDYMDLKLTPVIAKTAEAKADASVEVAKAQAKQIALSATIDGYRDFAKAVKAIDEIPDDLGIDKARLIQELAKKIDILQAN